MLVKYEETIRADSLQDDPNAHADLGPLEPGRHESSLRRSRMGLSQIARLISFLEFA